MPLLHVLLILLSTGAGTESPRASPWIGAWTFDLCHEDRKGDHDKDSYCREGKDRLEVAADAAGRLDITRCPADPWGERGVRVDRRGRRLRFRTKDGLDVRLVLGPDGARFRGTFRSRDGHAGRAWGRRVAGCR